MRDEDTARRIKKWYRSKRWQDLRAAHLARYPFCQCPHHREHTVKADDPEYGGAVVDHDTPHRGVARVFWDRKNLRSMTKRCHDSGKQSLEKGGAGFLRGCDEDGWPLDKSHPTYG